MTTTPPPGGYPRRWIGLFAVLAATLMNLLDANVMNVAAPTIRRRLLGTKLKRRAHCCFRIPV